MRGNELPVGKEPPDVSLIRAKDSDVEIVVRSRGLVEEQVDRPTPADPPGMGRRFQPLSRSMGIGRFPALTLF
jgi:hypothetical protein